ncbi:MAG: hypothetical protein K8J31_04595, partial [Anaerolineae bacterium]|nr:hypothetical protein [Anaerolineae bacterium]
TLDEESRSVITSLVSLALVVTSLVVIGISVWQQSRQRIWGQVDRYLLAGLALANLVLVIFLWVNHLNFPLNLEAMEGSVRLHVLRAASFQPIYTEPSADFVALAYNPLYYVLAAPFTWVLGDGLPTLRLVSVIGAVGAALVIFAVVRRHTGSIWWGLMAAGLFAAAYGATDYYLDTIHSDSWFLLTALLGTYLIDRSRSFSGSLAGLVLLILSFWLKQHGALFAIGGVLFLLWREGLRRGIVYGLVAALFGPALYFLAGPALFGPYFLYFTWEVPRTWSEVSLSTFRRLIRYSIKYLPALAVASTWFTAWAFLRNRKALNFWHIQFVVALFSGFMGALDPGSQNNVFIPMATWTIIMGVLGIHHAKIHWASLSRYHVPEAALLLSFVLLIYSPPQAFRSSESQQAYADLVEMLNSLDGPVYAPDLGQLQSGYTLYPAAEGVAMEDLIRGLDIDQRYNPLMMKILQPAMQPPDQKGYLLLNNRLGRGWFLDFLLDYYVLDTDFQDRFISLWTLPSSFSVGYPRYLYRYDPEQAAANPSS